MGVTESKEVKLSLTVRVSDHLQSKRSLPWTASTLNNYGEKLQKLNCWEAESIHSNAVV